MNRRILAAAMATCLSVFAVPAVWAAPTSFPLFSNNAKAPKSKKVNFQIRNDGAAPLTISTGADQYTIQPHRAISLKLDQGTMVTAVNASGKTAAGSVLATVSAQLEGNTLAIS
jgi:hypothetical protein